LIWVSSYYNSSVSAYILKQFADNACLQIDQLVATTLGNSQSGISHPEGVAVDSYGDLLVSNSSKNAITNTYTITAYNPNPFGVPDFQNPIQLQG
jgi:hypothetical protein